MKMLKYKTIIIDGVEYRLVPVNDLKIGELIYNKQTYVNRFGKKVKTLTSFDPLKHNIEKSVRATENEVIDWLHHYHKIPYVEGDIIVEKKSGKEHEVKGFTVRNINGGKIYTIISFLSVVISHGGKSIGHPITLFKNKQKH